MNDILEKLELDDSKPIRELVLNALRKAIFENKLKAGEKLTENAIAEALGVSRTPVREALRQLELEKLAVNTPRKGTVVSEISVEDALQMYEIREVLEGLAVRLACNNMPRKEILHLSEIVDEMDNCVKTGDIQPMFDLSTQWNRSILAYTQNEYLVRTMQDLYDQLGRLRIFSMQMPSQQEFIVSEIKEVLACIRAGDMEGCERAARHHVYAAKLRFLERVNRPKDNFMI